jgi:hypothetical protein
MKRLFQFGMLLGIALTPGLAAKAQQEGPAQTQALVNVDSKSTPPASASAVTVQVNDHKQPLTAWEAVAPANSQVAILIDDGLRQSVGRELDNLRNFVRGLPPGVEVLVGFMQYGHVVSEQDFTADHELAASGFHLPEGMPGMSASPYLCLSDFVKHWPGKASDSAVVGVGVPAKRKARFVLMLTNGVDPYNGSTSVMNQDSPYVKQAITDSQRAGVAVYAIYFGDAGIGGMSADNSGQSYLAQLTEGTGGVSLWQGVGNPVSMTPFLGTFQRAIAETYIATFNVPLNENTQKDLVQVKFTASKAKLRAPEKVRPGNLE